MLVKARNKIVLEEIEQAIRDGCKKIVVLYGGLHMQVCRLDGARRCFKGHPCIVSSPARLVARYV